MDREAMQQKWDARYRDASDDTSPIEVLRDYDYLLPGTGQALDLACGLGGNALYLADRGMTVDAWDISPVAVARLQARAAGSSIEASVRDVTVDPPEPGRYDVICVGHFLERDLCPALGAALRLGGLLFYQTWTSERTDDSGPGDGPYRLQVNELLHLFPDLVVRAYREEGTLGDPERGFRNRAQLVAQRAG